MGEAEVDERVFALEILLGELAAVHVCEVEWSADEGFADAFVGVGDTGTSHTSFFVAEVDRQTDAGEEEERACLPGKGLWSMLVVLGVARRSSLRLICSGLWLPR